MKTHLRITLNRFPVFAPLATRDITAFSARKVAGSLQRDSTAECKQLETKLDMR